MASNTKINCGPCEYLKIFVPANVWCPLCEEGLCNECITHHKAAKATRSHEPVPISFYDDIQNNMYDLNTECQLHNEKFELYCPNHETHCCVQCANQQHSQCKGITLLNKFVENIKSSEVLASFKQKFEDRTKSIDSLKENRFLNIRRVQEQSYTIVNEFESYEKNVIENLARYKNMLKSEAEELTATKKATIMETVDTLESQKAVYDEMLTRLTKIETSGTNLQVYLLMKKLEEKFAKEDDVTKTIEKKDGIQEIDISFSPNSELHSLTSETRLGRIEIKKYSQKIDLKETKNALTPVTRCIDKLEVRTIINTKTATKTYLFGETANLSSIALLPNGDTIITDNGDSGGILLFDKAGNFISKVTKFGKAHGVCLISSSLLAFSFPSNQNIKFLNIKSCTMTLSHTVRINLLCAGLSVSEDKVLACVRPAGIYVIDLDGTILKIVNVDKPAITFVHCYQNQMIITDYFSDTIKSFDMDGTELWTLNCESGPDTRNCCTDKFGNIFVSEKNSGNILLISTEENNKMLIVGRNLDNPKAIAYDRDSDSLIIASANGKHCAVYKLRRS